MRIREQLASAVAEAAEAARRSGVFVVDVMPPVQLDLPPTPDVGDFSSDIAVSLARTARVPVETVAEAIVSRLRENSVAGLLAAANASASGILNFRLRAGWLEETIHAIRASGAEFGRSDDLGAGREAHVEFVSANPTVPLNVLHGRGAALGDALANLLSWNGYRVTREYYVNDVGSQIERFARSLEYYYLRALGRTDAAAPADGFEGEHLPEIAAALVEEAGSRYAEQEAPVRLRELAAAGLTWMQDRQRETLERMGVRFDVWRRESDLLSGSRLSEALDRLRASEYVYETEGALWLRSSALGDEGDRPLLRSNGQPTYLATDLAYHLEKFQRNFSRIIDIWGPDHATYIPRTKAGIQALGLDPSAVEIVVFQPVTLKTQGLLLETSAVGGNSFPLETVLQETGKATARFLFLQRGSSALLEIDLDQAEAEASESPARTVETALRSLREAAGSVSDTADLTGLTEPAERALMRKLADFPDEVRAAALELDPSRIARYAVEIAEQGLRCCSEWGSALGEDRRFLAEATGQVLENSLLILGCRPE